MKFARFPYIQLERNLLWYERMDPQMDRRCLVRPAFKPGERGIPGWAGGGGRMDREEKFVRKLSANWCNNSRGITLYMLVSIERYKVVRF